MPTSAPRPAGVPAVLRALVVLLGLLVPLHLPFTLPEPGIEKTLGWWSNGRPDGGRGLVVTQTAWYARNRGLAPGDRVVQVAGRKASERAVRAVLREAEIGDAVELRVERGRDTVTMHVPVVRGSLNYAGYWWFRLVLLVASWMVGLALVLWQGRSVPALTLSVALLLVGPAIFPITLPAHNPLLHAANLLWLHVDGGFRFVFPVVMAHFLVQQVARKDDGARGRARWLAAYGAVLAVAALCTVGFRDPLAWAHTGPSRTLRTVAAFSAELGALAVALRLRPGRRSTSAVRWLRQSFLAYLAVSLTVSLLILTVPGDLEVVDGLRQLKALSLLLVTTMGAIYCLSLQHGTPSDWHLRGRLSTTASTALTVLFGFAVAGAALVVHARESSLGEIEGMLFLTIFLASIAFSPVLRWSREMVDRQALARLAEMEARIGAFSDRLAAVLEPPRIAAAVAREVPDLLGVARAELVVSGERVAGWGLEEGEELAEAPRAILQAEAASEEDAGWTAEAVVGPGGEVIALLRVSHPGRDLDPPERTALSALVRGVAAALRISEGYLRLRQARSELADAERVADLGALAGGLAHEIKNPLLGLKLGIHLLRRESAQGDRLDRIADDVRRIDDLVTGLLRFTHDEMREDAAEALDLVAVVRDCVRELRPIAEDRETEVVEDYPLAPACVQGGRTQLRMVVSNLVRNAIDAAGESGVVQVAVEESPSSVSICVSDDGPGIPSHLRERIFDLAFSTKPGGSGIGLALARREAERMGGSIAVDEVPSGGTRFVVRLPAVTREAALAAD